MNLILLSEIQHRDYKLDIGRYLKKPISHKTNSIMILHFKENGNGEPILVLHGLFGMLDNWQAISKELAQEFRVISVDLRNHGRSFHHPEIDYPIMAKDLAILLDHLSIEKIHIIGHSMGGKVAIQFAADYTERIISLSVIDIAPISYERGHDDIFSAVLSIDINRMATRQDVQHVLSEKIPNKTVVQFLMKGLSRTESGFEWRTNFNALYSHYDQLKDRPEVLGTISCPTMLVVGRKSPYVSEEGISVAKQLFVNLKVTYLDTGHWVHAERPKELLDIFKTFIRAISV